MRRLLIAAAAALLWIPTAAMQERAEFFIQLADPQFGAFAQKDTDFAQETTNYEFAVANVNRLRPAFVVVCGDLINKTGDKTQANEYFRITSMIDRSIPVHAVAGNHDVGNEPTPETLKAYRARFGPDYYSFRHGRIYGIVLDTSVISAPGKVEADAGAQEAWLKAELVRAPAHQITSGPVGRPLGADPSGLRIVTVKDTALEHTYYVMGLIPNQFPIPPAVPRRNP